MPEKKISFQEWLDTLTPQDIIASVQTASPSLETMGDIGLPTIKPEYRPIYEKILESNLDPRAKFPAWLWKQLAENLTPTAAITGGIIGAPSIGGSALLGMGGVAASEGLKNIAPQIFGPPMPQSNYTAGMILEGALPGAMHSTLKATELIPKKIIRKVQERWLRNLGPNVESRYTIHPETNIDIPLKPELLNLREANFPLTSADIAGSPAAKYSISETPWLQEKLAPIQASQRMWQREEASGILEDILPGTTYENAVVSPTNTLSKRLLQIPLDIQKRWRSLHSEKLRIFAEARKHKVPIETGDFISYNPAQKETKEIAGPIPLINSERVGKVIRDEIERINIGNFPDELKALSGGWERVVNFTTRLARGVVRQSKAEVEGGPVLVTLKPGFTSVDHLYNAIQELDKILSKMLPGMKGRRELSSLRSAMSEDLKRGIEKLEPGLGSEYRTYASKVRSLIEESESPGMGKLLSVEHYTGFRPKYVDPVEIIRSARVETPRDFEYLTRLANGDKRVPQAKLVQELLTAGTETGGFNSDVMRNFIRKRADVWKELPSDARNRINRFIHSTDITSTQGTTASGRALEIRTQGAVLTMIGAALGGQLWSLPSVRSAAALGEITFHHNTLAKLLLDPAAGEYLLKLRQKLPLNPSNPRLIAKLLGRAYDLGLPFSTATGVEGILNPKTGRIEPKIDYEAPALVR